MTNFELKESLKKKFNWLALVAGIAIGLLNHFLQSGCSKVIFASDNNFLWGTE